VDTCLTPTMVDSTTPGATTDVLLRMVYEEQNLGSREAANWTNVMHWDGQQVRVRVLRSTLSLSLSSSSLTRIPLRGLLGVSRPGSTVGD
jgi:hypothetical protein